MRAAAAVVSMIGALGGGCLDVPDLGQASRYGHLPSLAVGETGKAFIHRDDLQLATPGERWMRAVTCED